MNCLVCGDEIVKQPQGANGLQCEIDPEHVQCRECSQAFVRHCCESDELIPITCAIPNCEFVFSEKTLKGVLVDRLEDGNVRDERWIHYEECMVRAALSKQGIEADLDEKELLLQETPLRCNLCSSHSLYVMAPMSY